MSVDDDVVWDLTSASDDLYSTLFINCDKYYLPPE